MAAAGLTAGLRLPGRLRLRGRACRGAPRARTPAAARRGRGRQRRGGDRRAHRASATAGVDVPGEVSVAGIDDTRPARFVDLTTVSLPLYDLGAVAARHILATPDEAAAEADVVLPHRLVPRRSTARRT